MEPNKLQHDSFIPNPAAPANIFVRIKTVLTYEPPIGQSPPAYLFFKQRYFRALVFLLMCLFNTIVYTGWQHFAIMLYRSGAYRWQCSESELKKLKSLEDPCEGAQTNSVQALLRVGLSSEFICGVFAGLSLDHLGPWFTALLGCVSFFLGWMGLVYSTQKFQAYIPAMVLLAGSVNFVAFPCLSLGDLFPEYAGLAVSLVVAAQTTATAVAPVMVLVWDSYPEYSYGHIIWGYLAVAFFPVASLYLLCVPWSRLTVDPLSSIEDHSAAVGDSDAHSGTKGHPEIEHPQKEQEVLATTSHVGISHATIEEMSFLSQITSVEFIMFTVYYVIQVLQFSYYPSTVQPQYGSEMSNFSGWALTSQGLFGALFGLVVDKTKTLPICVVLVLMMTGAYVTAIIPSYRLQYFTTFLYVISNSYIYTVKYTYIAEIFPPPHFGVMIGLMGFIAGVAALLNIPIDNANQYIITSIAYSVLGCIALVVVLFLWVRQRKGINYRNDTVQLKELE